MIVYVLLFFVFLWLVGLSYFVWKLQAHYNTLTEGTNSRTLQAVLDNVMHDILDAKKHLLELDKQTHILQLEGALHIQKIGLLRFNPFNDTGGDQSFIFALLDKQNTGIVISGLYSRSGTRWYAKRVETGKGVEHELSREERKAIELAKTNQDQEK